ncbi:MATE family efflux transporter [Murimonas intestini]|uniref:MATE family efflux transporter n=1 Tax=Murimonas intestini TaxID=1337051 RepID=UPI0011DD1D92|nr:MATE family efflux transporter [Murimonas intestini]
MTNDMTKGNPLKLIIMFTIPVLIGNIFQNFYNIVDSIIVGQFLGVDALAAVGTTGSINFLVIGWVSGMTSGFAILIAQSFGAGDHKRLRHYVAMSIYLCAAMAAVMTAGLLIANEPVLRLMNTPDNIFEDTRSYIAIIYAGLPVTIMYNMLAGTARSLGDSKTPLYFLILSSLLNIGLDLLFVAVLPLGVAGAAYATVLAQGVSAVLCFFYVRRHFEILHFSREDARFNGRSAWRLMVMGIPMALQFSITGLGTMIVQASLNLLGSAYIAAFAAAIKVQNIIVQVFPSLGVTMATFAGQNAGAGKIKRIRKGMRQAFFIVLGGSVVCALIVYFLGDSMVTMFVKDPTGEIRSIARQMFRISMWFYPFLGTIFLFRNVLQGLGDGFVPMLGGVFELFARWLAIVLLAAPLGYVGICLTDPCAWVSALIPLIPVYFVRMKRLMRWEQEKMVAAE